jgi:hypothetical protein
MSKETITLPVIDERFLDEQIKACDASACLECNQGRDCPQRIEYADSEPMDWLAVSVVALILTVICVAAFSPEIAAFVYKISN